MNAKEIERIIDKGKGKHETRGYVIREDMEKHLKQQKVHNNPKTNFVAVV